MQKFIARENIRLFERKLAESRDPQERDRLNALIDKERECLRQLAESSPLDVA